MPLQYFKPDTRIATRCENCGAQQQETLARLYSDAMLICARCGCEHTAERAGLRQSVDETEAMLASPLPVWGDRLLTRLRHWWQNQDGAGAP